MKNILKSLFLCALLCSCQVAGTQSSGSPPAALAQKTMVIGHRGAAGLAPENTLTAFARACSIGVDGIELDVLFSADRELVVFHDLVLKPEIVRKSDGRWLNPQEVLPVGSITRKQLRQFDVGRLKPGTAYSRRYPDQQPEDGQQIPTLSEVIGLVKTACPGKPRLLIEIKTSPEEPGLSADPEEIVQSVVSIIKAAKIEDRTMLLSFDWRNLVHAQKIAPRIPTVYLSLLGLRLNNIKPGRPGASAWMAGLDIDDYSGSLPQAVRAAGGRFWAPYFKNLTLQDLREARRLGLSVFVWTPDSRADLLRMLEWGVDGIITNRPDVLMSLR